MDEIYVIGLAETGGVWLWKAECFFTNFDAAKAALEEYREQVSKDAKIFTLRPWK